LLRGLFVTGTDTGVGKTVASAALLLRYRNTRYWKPIQTGTEQDDDTAEAVRLSGCEACNEGVRLKHPVSPHLAARWAGESIDVTALATLVDGGGWIVEGAGGVLVPLAKGTLMADFIRMLDIPTLVVARSGLGTINHTLLTLEALRARSIPIAGVLLAGDPNPENRAAIESYGGVRVIAEMPRFAALDELPFWATTYFDPDGQLREFLS
jgi:dethiobiotin synthetase